MSASSSVPNYVRNMVLVKNIIGKVLRFPLHPFLFAVYPILFLYAYNLKEVTTDRTFVPLAIAISSTFVFWIIFVFALKDKLKAGFIVTIFILIFYSYGYIFDVFYEWNLFTVKHRYFMPIILYIGGYAAYFVCLIRRQIVKQNITFVLNVVAIVLFTLNILKIIPNEINKIDFFTKSEQHSVVKDEYNTETIADYPDIYYIILDEYASSDTIRKIWGYDNSGFEGFLRNKGFFVSNKSKSRSISTVNSLVNSLNMEYHPDDTGYEDSIVLLNNNKVMKYLKTKGYWTVVIENILEVFGADKVGIMADSNLHIESGNIGIFSDLILQHSLLKPFIWPKNISNIFREATLFNFKSLNDTINGNNRHPVFVFSHFLCPHAPFVFGKNGEEVGVAHWREWGGTYYRDQYIFITNQISEMVTKIMNKNSNSVIIIQSDHGPRAYESRTSLNSVYDFVVPIEEQYKIFNAIFVPKIKRYSMPDNFSPVNTFRLIFNTYFDEKFEMLEN